MMANAQRGEVELKNGSKTYILKFTTNAMCDLEDHFGCDIQGVFARLSPEDGSGARLSDMRRLVLAMLSGKHPEMTIKDVGVLIDEVGVSALSEKLAQAGQLAFPSDEGGEGSGGKGIG